MENVTFKLTEYKKTIRNIFNPSAGYGIKTNPKVGLIPALIGGGIIYLLTRWEFGAGVKEELDEMRS